MRADEVNYQKLSKSMARVLRYGKEDGPNEDKVWSSVKRIEKVARPATRYVTIALLLKQTGRSCSLKRARSRIKGMHIIEIQYVERRWRVSQQRSIDLGGNSHRRFPVLGKGQKVSMLEQVAQQKRGLERKTENKSPEVRCKLAYAYQCDQPTCEREEFLAQSLW